MTRACWPSPAWLPRWALALCAASFLVARLAAAQCTGPSFDPAPYPGSPPITTPWGVVVGDFYGPGGVLDGRLDVVATRDVAAGEVVLLRGDDTGNLTEEATVTVGSSLEDVVAADLDRDGTLDLAVADSTTFLRLLKGTGETFEIQTAVDVGFVPTRLAAADLDRDGYVDIVVAGEGPDQVRLLKGAGFTFSELVPNLTPDAPSAVAIGDFGSLVDPFSRDGWPDLAVALRSDRQVQIYHGPAFAAGATLDLATPPKDIATADVNGDGHLDLVIAEPTGSRVEVLLGDGLGGFPTIEEVTSSLPDPPLHHPTRVELVDFDQDGALDLVVLDHGLDQVVVFRGVDRSAPVSPPPPSFLSPPLAPPVVVDLTDNSNPKSFAVADVKRDGRPDLVVAETNVGRVVVAPANGPPPCPRPSFYDAPRAYDAGDQPLWAAAADLVEDGHEDLVVASNGTVEVLAGNGNGFTPFSSLGTPLPGRGVATADFDFDGHADVVVVMGHAFAGEVSLYRGRGDGSFEASPDTDSVGNQPSAVVVGDFNGDGAPDAAVTSQSQHLVHVFIGDGAGNLDQQAESPLNLPTSLPAPRALAVGDINNDSTLDLVVANSDLDSVTIYSGDKTGGIADGTFTEIATLTMGLHPWGVALADFNGDSNLDIVTSDHGASTATVRLGQPGVNFDFGGPVGLLVGAVPIAVAGFDVSGDDLDDVSVVTGNQTLAVFQGDGAGGFAEAAHSPVRSRPSNVVAVDADSDGQKDVAVPCKDADSLVVLLARPPNGFAEVTPIAVGSRPSDIATADLDGDGDLDLAVVNSNVSGTVSILLYDHLTGTFGVHASLDAGNTPEAVAIADLDLDGIPDLAVSSGSNVVYTFEGTGGGNYDKNPGSGTTVAFPDDLTTGDFDRDGDPDLAVCSGTGHVVLILNDRGFSFDAQPPVSVGGSEPTAIVAADLDRNGTLDVAVANANSDNISVLLGDGGGGFAPPEVRASDDSPQSIAAGDFDGDGDADLAVAAFGTSTLNVFENEDGSFPGPPSSLDAPLRPLFMVAGDVNHDGDPDLAIAEEGVQVLAGAGGLGFAASEDLVARLEPRAVALGDFNRDGRPDIAVANRISNDVAILYSTACLPRRVVVTTSPDGCGAVGALGTSVVQVQDDAGNVSTCETGNVTASVLTGPPSLGGTTTRAAVDGVTTFDDLTLDQAGRYRLGFTLTSSSLTGVSRLFSRGAEVSITGLDAVCAGGSEDYASTPGFDTYRWTLDAVPFDWRPSTSLSQPPLIVGNDYSLKVEACVDTCLRSDSKTIRVGDLVDVGITSPGPFSVCETCLGGTFTVSDLGGGASTHQWGYRTSSLGTITDIPGETGSTYVLKGADFPGPGTYYVVVETTPTCGPSSMVSDEVAVSVTSAAGSGEARSLGVTSRGDGSYGENVLQWVNTAAPSQILIRWNVSTGGTSDCSPPLDRFVPADDEWLDSSPSASVKSVFVHDTLVNDTAYCYTVFVEDSGTWSPGRTVIGRPSDTTGGPVKWAYATGATAVVPPTVGSYGIIALSNDRTVHSLERGASGGVWPTAWMPATLPGLAHTRSPVVPGVAGVGAVLFVADDTGSVTAINAETGGVVWGPVKPTGSDSMRGAPGGIFTRFRGSRDLILVGSISANPSVVPSEFYGIDVTSGTVLETFDGGSSLGPVMTSPALDYNGDDRVYVTSQPLGSGHTVWSLRIGDLSTEWSQDVGGVVTSPVHKDGKVYVGLGSEEVIFLDTTNGGAPCPPFSTAPDGNVKGFIFPDRQDNNLLFSTDTRVWSLRDDGGALVLNWEWDGGGGVEPGIPLQWPRTKFLYVGGPLGRLYQLDFSSGAPSNTCSPAPSASTCVYVQLGDGQDRLGAPSLDLGMAPPLLHIGSESGVVYAVEVPF